MKVSLQVAETLKALHLGVRKDLRRALDDLAAGERRDVPALRHPLVGYYRLRVGKYRVIFRVDAASGEIRAEFRDRRATVYKSVGKPE